MIYRLKTQVESDSYTESPIVVEYKQFTITFETQTQEPDSQNRFVNSISVSCRIDNFRDFLPKFMVNAEGKGSHALSLSRYPLDREEMIQLFHYIESMGSFWLNIKRVHFREMNEEWIPESEEEKSQVSVNSFCFKSEYTRKPELLDPTILARVIQNMDNYDYLTVSLAFYRVARNEFQNFNYYFAFMSYYLFLDSLFSNGKFRQKGVISAFKSCDLLRTAVESALNQIGRDSKKMRQIKDFLDKKNKRIDEVDDVIEFLVVTRGDLFHVSLRNLQQKVHILNQKEFQPVAFLISAICSYVVSKIANDSSLRREIE